MSHMPRVSFFLPTLDGGGAERALVTVAGALRTAGVDAELIVGDARGALRDALPGDLAVTDLGRRRIRSAVPALVRALRTRRPVCVISTLDHANIVAVVAARLSRSGARAIVRVANTLSEAAIGSSPRERAVMRATRLVYPWAAAVVAPAPHVADDLVTFSRLPRDAIRVIPNPVIGEDFAARRSAPIEHPWFAPGQPPVVLGVGRLVRQKRFELLIDAFQRVRQHAAARLLILGEGPERDALARRVAGLGLSEDVGMPGFDPNPVRYMARAEVVVSTSRYEGLPAVLIEALACDAKIVATDCPGGSAQILGDGAHGRLVASDQPGDVADAVLAALNEPRRPNDGTSWAPYTVDNAATMYRQLITDMTTGASPATHPPKTP